MRYTLARQLGLIIVASALLSALVGCVAGATSAPADDARVDATQATAQPPQATDTAMPTSTATPSATAPPTATTPPTATMPPATATSLPADPTAPPQAAAPAAVPAPQGPTPEQRVQSFIYAFVDAVNNPNIRQPATQQAEAAKLASYVVPSQQAAAQARFADLLAQIAYPGARIGQSDLDIRVQASVNNLQTQTLSQTADAAQVEVVAGTVTVWLVGPDVDKLPVNPERLTRTVTVSDIVNAGRSNVVGLRNIDNVWYIEIPIL